MLIEKRKEFPFLKDRQVQLVIYVYATMEIKASIDFSNVLESYLAFI
jgi:hypothetical protein